jgi:hypothetical protein
MTAVVTRAKSVHAVPCVGSSSWPSGDEHRLDRQAGWPVPCEPWPGSGGQRVMTHGQSYQSNARASRGQEWGRLRILFYASFGRAPGRPRFTTMAALTAACVIDSGPSAPRPCATGVSGSIARWWLPAVYEVRQSAQGRSGQVGQICLQVQVLCATGSTAVAKVPP